MPDAAFFTSPVVIARTFVLSYGFWIVLEVWIFSRDLRRVSGKRRDRGTVVLITLGITAANFILFLAPHLWPWARIPIDALVPFWAGMALVWLGIAVRLWALFTLGRHFRTAVRVLDEHELVTKGPYRFLRHPSYTGSILIVSGFGLSLGNWISFGGAFAAVFIAFAGRILVEEAALKDRFGEEYRAYRKRTWAVLPPLW